MKIEESCVRLDASHEYERRCSIETESSFSFRQTLKNAMVPMATEKTAATEASESTGRQRILSLLQQLLTDMIERLSGEKCRCGGGDFAALPLEEEVPRERPRRVIEWQTSSVERIEEHEKTEVSARGKVKTADGREIDFDLQLAMCRDFSCTREYEERGRIELKDPLVINFDGKAAELSERSFSFDIDADGKAELLPELATGSGYLTFDADRDGKIADGRELFGATGQHAGNGFADLAKLDSDKNGWIDEADPAFAALGVWFPDGQLKGLKDTGVGALNLDSVFSPFALKDEANNTRGQIWRSGVYLAENGEAGTLQQIDLGISKPPTG